MDQKATLAISAMMNCFPPGREDIDVRMRSLNATLSGVASSAIVRAAERFMAGDVEKQSTTRAPTVPEFTQEAKRIDGIEHRLAQAKPEKEHRRRAAGPSPMELEIERRKAKYANRRVLHNGIPLERHREVLRTCPPGAEWCWYHKAIFGPRREA